MGSIGEQRRYSNNFSAVPASVSSVRVFVREILDRHNDTESVLLVASELATNVVRHAKTEYTVTIELRPTLRIEVSDGSSIIPALEDLTADQRGFAVVTAVTSGWGIEATDTGKTIWATFSE